MRKKKLLLFLLLIPIALIAQGGGQPIPITIQNPSFEVVVGQIPSGDHCGSYAHEGQVDIPGWKWGADSGIFQPTSPPCGPSLVAYPPPDGVNFAYAGYGGRFWQDLGIKPSTLQSVSRDGIYMLSFYHANYFGVYPGYWEAKISIGTPQVNGSWPPPANIQELCSFDANALQIITETPLLCTVPGYFVFDERFPDDGSPAVPANPNDHLFISFTGYGWTVLFDKVSMSFTPES